MDNDQIHECAGDEELSAMLHRLFIIEGHKEVVVNHPVDGEQVITREDYQKLIKNIKKAKDMSPAERLVETTRLRNQHQIKFRTSMITAKFYTVDIGDEKSFGYDIDGNKLDLEDMTFVPTEQYLKGIEYNEDEIGAFVDERNVKPPLRILKK